MRRPLIGIPARFSESASALRYRAIVNARALSQAVFEAGGEPVTVHPWAPGGVVSTDEVAERLAFVDGVLLPGGGDLEPSAYGQERSSHHVYDVDVEQDAFDLAVARWALETGVPLLAVCRGMQIVNVACGGTLEQHMDAPHSDLVQEFSIEETSMLAGVVGGSVTSSCYHHQRLDRIASGLVATAWAADGTVEALEMPDAAGWFLAVQWHPEDTVDSDPAQRALLTALVEASREPVLAPFGSTRRG
jgi:putative glutamine amidotransferase